MPFNAEAAGTVAAGARRALTSLAESVGATGLPAAAARPGLLAVLDQHAAAVRDSLWGDLRPMTAVTLAGYVEGVRDAAVEHGWVPPSGPVDWSAPDWVLLRLLAVCALAADLDRR